MDAVPNFDGQNLFELFDLASLARNGMDSWLVETLERCAAWFRASGASAFLIDADGVFRIRGKTGKQARIPNGAIVHMGEGIAGTVLLSGQPRIVGDPSKDSMLSGKRVASKTHIASSMVVPLIGPSDERIGVLNFSRTEGEPKFDESELGQAAKLGAHVAMAVANARLVDLLQKSLAAQDKRTDQLTAVLGTMAGSVHIVDEAGGFEAGSIPNPWLSEKTSELLGLMSSSGEPVETKVYDKETDETWILNVSPLRTGGAVITTQDFTKYQRAEEEAGRLRRLAEIGQMTAAVAHELRNPLTGIKGAAQLILSEPALALEYAQVIEEEATKLDALCSDFLELSRPLRLSIQPAKLAEVAERVHNLWEQRFAQKGVTLELRSEGRDDTVSIDPKRVEQVVHNLLRNALDASKVGGRVTVTVTEGLLAVTDEGVGMDAETKARLFSPFFTTKADGSGLGLCNVRRIIDAHGASVEVWSEPGKGARFEVSFKKKVA